MHAQIKPTGMETLVGTLLTDFSITAPCVTAVTDNSPFLPSPAFSPAMLLHGATKCYPGVRHPI